MLGHRLPQGNWHGNDQGTLYDNGPINGNTDAWAINYGFAVSDTFTVGSGSATAVGMTFGAWLFAGDVMQSVEVSITSQPFGGTTYFDQVVSFTQSGCSENSYGFNICTESGSFEVDNLASGTYWVNLQNAVVNTGDPVYWDENSGPSLAQENSVGTIPSEAFTILSQVNTNPPPPSCMPEQDGSFKVVHDFTGGGDGGNPTGVALDRAGNVYGATGYWSENGAIYKLAPAGTGWILSPLYNFAGGNDGALPSGVVVGNNGVLHGVATGGNPDCYGGCGLIFDLRPEPTVCRSTSCYWTQDVAYGFTGPSDAHNGGGLVSDAAGNLYGVSESGGAQQAGAVFELTPSLGGWIETILYSFAGGNGGDGPTSVVLGNDGSLYGMTFGGGLYNGGVVFQLSPAPNGWTETVLYNLPSGAGGGGFPPTVPLIQDRRGNLFGEYYFTTCCADEYGILFELSPSSGQWMYSEVWRADTYTDYEFLNNLAVDAAGNLYATGYALAGGCMGGTEYGFIFEFIPTDSGWQYETPRFWGNTVFPTSGSLALDAKGNLYGTTGFCGAYGNGTVWQLSP